MEFTKEMRNGYTIYLPAMLDHHFPLIRQAMRGEGYKVRVLKNDVGERVLPRNCACYPVSRMVGQMVAALESGVCENPNRSAFLLPPAGAGCRGENHFLPIEMALEDAGYPKVPILALDVRERQFFPGLSVTPGLVRKALSAVMVGDFLQMCLLDAAPYEAEAGSAEALHRHWVEVLGPRIAEGRLNGGGARRDCYQEIAHSFQTLPRVERATVKAALLGEPYLKYCALGNRDLLRTLWSKGCHVWISGFTGYADCVVDGLRDQFQRSGSRTLKNACVMVRDYVCHLQKELLAAARAADLSCCPSHFTHVMEEGNRHLGDIRVDDCWYLGADGLDAVAHGFEVLVVPHASGCLMWDRISRDALSAVERACPQVRILGLDYSGDAQVRAETLDQFLEAERGKLQ